MTEPSPSPTAEGNLAATPFAHLVLYLYQHKSSGTLAVQLPGASTAVRVLFQKGRGVAARFPEAHDTLDAGLLPLCQVSDAAFAFYEDDLVGSGRGVLTGMFDPHAFVAQSVRTHPRADAIEGVLTRFGSERLRLQPGVDISRFKLTADEAKLVEVLRAEPIDIAQLCEQSELSPEAARRLIYVLIVTKAVAPYRATEDSAASHVRAREPSDTPSAKSSAVPAPSASSKSSSSIPAQSPRTPAPSAPPASSKSSASIPAQPPRSPTPPAPPNTQPTHTLPPRPVNSSWQNIAARAGAAASARPSTSLRPPGASGGSVTLKSTPATPRPSMAPPELLDLPSKVKRVEQLIQRRAFDEAFPLIRAACAEAPNVAKHQGLLAFVMFSRSADNATVAKEIVEAVNQALRLDEDDAFALYTKALCYKRAAKDREALHYFKRAAAVDPSNIDAAREARLYALRAASEEKKKR